MNEVKLSGKIINIVTFYTKANQAVTRYTLAVKRSANAKKTNFIRCVTFGDIALAAARFNKNDELEITGSITTGSYTKDGQTIYTTDVTVDTQTLTAKAPELGEPETAKGFDNKPVGITVPEIPDALEIPEELFAS